MCFPPSWAVLHHQHSEEPADAEWHPCSQAAPGWRGGAASPAQNPAEARIPTTVGAPLLSRHQHVLPVLSHNTMWLFNMLLYVTHCLHRLTKIDFLLLLLSCREEQDLEYARVIQEEIQRRAEEAWRRERDDEVSTHLQISSDYFSSTRISRCTVLYEHTGSEWTKTMRE